MMNRDQLRAARILLHLDQRELAEKASVAVVTVRRFEGGEAVGQSQVQSMRRAVEKAGAILISADGPVDGGAMEAGVGLCRREDLPEDTKARIARDDFGRRKAGAKPEGRSARARKRSIVDDAVVAKPENAT